MSTRKHRPALDHQDLRILELGQRAAIELVEQELRSLQAGQAHKVDALLDARRSHRAMLERITGWREVSTRS